jgi:hypothetical protein
VLATPNLRTTENYTAFSPKERAAMKEVTRLKIGPVALLVLLVLLTLLVVKREQLTAEEAADDAVGVAVKVKDSVVRDKHATVAFVGLIALFGFVIWTALRAKEEDKTIPPAKESSASGTTEFR